MKVRYINTKGFNNKVETVDEFEYSTSKDRAYFYQMMKEYRFASPEMGYYASSRCTKEWRNR